MRSASAPAARRKSRAGIAQVLQKHGGARGAANQVQFNQVRVQSARRRSGEENGHAHAAATPPSLGRHSRVGPSDT